MAYTEAACREEKPSLPSGGRLWAEDEEAYLVQTRRQKMPYKHIAAHLNKTELACRLHYHQLLRSAGRRKRALGPVPDDPPAAYDYSPLPLPLPPPSPKLPAILPKPSTPPQQQQHQQVVDMARLQAIYRLRKDAFWTAVAAEYGPHASPLMLETAWMRACWVARSTCAPPTPAASPEVNPGAGRGLLMGRDRIRIASILASEEELRR